MDSESHSSPSESTGVKAAFRKPSNDAVNRKYRRRSPSKGSSSSDESPKRERGSSPPSRNDRAKDLDNQRRKDVGKNYERDHGRSQYDRKGDSHRHSDRPLSRSSSRYHRHDDDIRREKHAEDDQRNLSKSSSGSASGSHYEHGRRESEYNRSRDHSHKRDLDGRDDRRDHRTNSRDSKGDRSHIHEESRGHQSELLPRRDSSGHRIKEASRKDYKDLDDTKNAKDVSEKSSDRETNRNKERRNRGSVELFDDKSVLENSNHESSMKKLKLFGSGKSTESSKETGVPSEIQSSSSKQVPESVCKVNTELDFVKDADIDAAKIAAMKAAELVNRNLIGTGYMSTDQKKKLLWGSKKSTTTEEPAHHWDTSLLSDREQEKFNKLMSLRLHWYLWPIVGCERRIDDRTKAKQPRRIESPHRREAERDRHGVGEALHCRPPQARWSYRRAWALNFYDGDILGSVFTLCCMSLPYFSSLRNLFALGSATSLAVDLCFCEFELLVKGMLLDRGIQTSSSS